MYTFVPKWPSLRIKQVLYSIVTVLLTFLFLGRIPFYKIFNSSYNAMLINGKNDDISAIVNTAINEYNALMYIVGAVVLSAALCWFLVRFLGWGAKKYSDYVGNDLSGSDQLSASEQVSCPTWYPKTKKTQWMTGIGLTVAIGVLGLFFRFGGAFSYTNSINWESAARFLEEAKYVSGMDTGAVYVENKPDYLDKLVEDYELKIYSDQEAFYDAIDAVYIVVEPKYQFQAIMNALKHKKHVLVEFPILVTDEQLQEITDLADANGCIFMEGLKTAYTPAFGKLIALAKSGIIGNILSVDANFTQILGKQLAEQIRLVDGGSVNALASYPFLAFVKFLGLEYKDIQFFSRNDDKGLDMFTKILVSYENAVATSNVAISGKSEGDMIISGDKGYIYVPAPWWKTEYFEVRFEDLNMNRKYFYKFDGEGLRYEISEFIQCILNKKNSILLTIEEIRAITKMINQFNVANKVTF